MSGAASALGRLGSFGSRFGGKSAYSMNPANQLAKNAGSFATSGWNLAKDVVTNPVTNAYAGEANNRALHETAEEMHGGRPGDIWQAARNAQEFYTGLNKDDVSLELRGNSSLILAHHAHNQKGLFNNASQWARGTLDYIHDTRHWLNQKTYTGFMALYFGGGAIYYGGKAAERIGTIAKNGSNIEAVANKIAAGAKVTHEWTEDLRNVVWDVSHYMINVWKNDKVHWFGESLPDRMDKFIEGTPFLKKLPKNFEFFKRSSDITFKAAANHSGEAAKTIELSNFTDKVSKYGQGISKALIVAMIARDVVNTYHMGNQDWHNLTYIAGLVMDRDPKDITIQDIFTDPDVKRMVGGKNALLFAGKYGMEALSTFAEMATLSFIPDFKIHMPLLFAISTLRSSVQIGTFLGDFRNSANKLTNTGNIESKEILNLIMKSEHPLVKIWGDSEYGYECLSRTAFYYSEMLNRQVDMISGEPVQFSLDDLIIDLMRDGGRGFEEKFQLVELNLELDDIIKYQQDMAKKAQSEVEAAQMGDEGLPLQQQQAEGGQKWQDRFEPQSADGAARSNAAQQIIAERESVTPAGEESLPAYKKIVAEGGKGATQKMTDKFPQYSGDYLEQLSEQKERADISAVIGGGG